MKRGLGQFCGPALCVVDDEREELRIFVCFRTEKVLRCQIFLLTLRRILWGRLCPAC